MKSIPAFRLVAEPLSPEAKALLRFTLAPEEVGTRHKLGGQPDFIHQTEWPLCPTCTQRSSFVAQIDSVGDNFVFADCGMIFVFYCFDCNVSQALTQSM